jgi:hypothetical protein
MIRLAALVVALIATAAARAEPAAWRLEGRDGSELTLLGSVHYLRDRDHPLPGLVENLYARADAIVMELDLDDIDPRRTQAAFFDAAALPAGRRLSDVLDSDVYARTEREARTVGVELSMLDGFEPWLIAVTIMDLGMRRLGFRADRGVEQYLLGKARAHGKPVLGLETVETQIAVFDGLALSEQQALLEQALTELASADEVMTALVDAWRSGELEPLAQTLMVEFAEFPELYDALVVERNKSWITELERLLTDGTDYLVVVGALHLVGQDSVIDLLRARGFSVTRLD